MFTSAALGMILSVSHTFMKGEEVPADGAEGEEEEESESETGEEVPGGEREENERYYS